MAEKGNSVLFQRGEDFRGLQRQSISHVGTTQLPLTRQVKKGNLKPFQHTGMVETMGVNEAAQPNHQIIDSKKAVLECRSKEI